jgi:hypothetical protein
VNLKQILVAWIIQQYEDGTALSSFDQEKAKQDMRPAFSAASEYSAGRIKASLVEWARSGFVFVHLLPLGFFLTAIAVFWCGRVRRVSVAFLILVLLIVGDAALSNPLINVALPGGYAFLDDYVYLEDSDLLSSNPPKSNTIVAYERTPSSWRRLVGFADGHVKGLVDKELLPMLAAQGLTLAADASPTIQP